MAGAGAEGRVAGRSCSHARRGRTRNPHASHHVGRRQSSESRALVRVVPIHLARKTQTAWLASRLHRGRLGNGRLSASRWSIAVPFKGHDRAASALTKMNGSADPAATVFCPTWGKKLASLTNE